MNGDVIKSFLIGLGFEIDQAGLSRFTAGIKAASVRVAALGVAATAMAGGVVAAISRTSEGFEQMGYEMRIIAPAINKALLLRNAMLNAYKAAGVNLTKVVQQSVLLNFSLAKTKFAFEAIYKSVAARFFPLLTRQSDILRRKLYENMPRIQAGLEKFVTFTFKAFEILVDLGARVWQILSGVYGFFEKLHRATDGWSTIVLAVVAAWKLLNLSFLASPIGLIIAGITALIALWDDLETFREGGESLFDWSYAIPIIDDITSHLRTLGNVLGWIWGTVSHLFQAYTALSTFDFSGAAEHLKAFGAAEMGLLNGSALGLGASPLGSNSTTNNASTNQSVRQETNIHINGGDAQGTAKAVTNSQRSVNGEMIRNLKAGAR